MAMLEILHFPDPRLREKAEIVTDFKQEIQVLAGDMLETMYHAQGIGLAATQVGINKRILVLDVSEQRNQPLCLVNPEIITCQGNTVYKEGCLSVPGTYDEVERFEIIEVKAFDQYGTVLNFQADGLKSVCIQHEMDHLEGKLFIDYLSMLKRERIRKKLEKQKRFLKQDSKLTAST